jgi:hypothetical protein
MKSKNVVIIALLSGLALLSIIIGLTTCLPSLKNISLNVFGSAFVVLLIEIVSLWRDWSKYHFLAGNYVRTEITREKDNSIGDTKYADMTPYYKEKDVDSKVKIKYIADGKYSANVYYLGSEAIVTLTLDQSNPLIGTGTYQYLKVLDLGSYEFQVDKDKKKIYLFYSNLLPSGTARGYEVWERV